MKRIVQEELRQAYATPATMAEIIRDVFRKHRIGVSERTVQTFWREEKAAGRIADAPRPHFVARIVKADVEWDFDLDDDADDEALCAPLQGTGVEIPGAARQHARNEASSDALLAALIREHGSDPIVRLSDMPAHVLKMEADGFTPSRARVKQFARIRDIYTRALQRKFLEKANHVGR